MAAFVKQNKYGAVRAEIDGRTFASKKECRRYSELRLLERAGVIRNLELQKKYPLIVNDVKVATYLADFVYWHCETKQQIIEDVKSVATRTPVYRLKAKLMSALYNITILET